MMKGKTLSVFTALCAAAVTPECKLYRVYRKIAELAGVKCPDKAPEIGITHHPLPDGGEIRIAINYADHKVDDMKPNEVKIEKRRSRK